MKPQNFKPVMIHLSVMVSEFEKRICALCNHGQGCTCQRSGINCHPRELAEDICDELLGFDDDQG